MSSTDIPLKVEVIGWNHQQLAEYLRRKMTECDLQAFPCVYIPRVTQIQRDINKSEQKKGLGHKLRAHNSEPKQVLVKEEETWNLDEYGNDSQHDGSQSEDEARYIRRPSEPHTDEPYDSGDDYEIPFVEEKVEPTQHRTAPPLPDTRSKDENNKPIPAERLSKLSHRETLRMNNPPMKPKIPAGKPSLHPDRSKTLGQRDKSPRNSEGSTVEASGSSTLKGPAALFNRANKYISKALVEPSKADKSIPEPDKEGAQQTGVSEANPHYQLLSRHFQSLDPSWYAGKITRRQAEVALRELNEDGTFVVRDSSRGSDKHPYTLMLLKQGKVYNIKIQNRGKSYILGTGLNGIKSFPGVKEMITHHMHTPLPLIDATDPNQEQNHCCLLHPAGL